MVARNVHLPVGSTAAGNRRNTDSMGGIISGFQQEYALHRRTPAATTAVHRRPNHGVFPCHGKNVFLHCDGGTAAGTEREKREKKKDEVVLGRHVCELSDRSWDFFDERKCPSEARKCFPTGSWMLACTVMVMHAFTWTTWDLSWLRSTTLSRGEQSLPRTIVSFALAVGIWLAVFTNWTRCHVPSRNGIDSGLFGPCRHKSKQRVA